MDPATRHDAAAIPEPQKSTPGILWTVHDCALREVRQIRNPHGTLGVIEAGSDVPFAVQRIFYLHGVPARAHRAGHALKSCHQFLIPVAGRFTVTLRDRRETKIIELNSPCLGLFLPPMVWRELDGFSEGAVCLVLASEPYDASGYYRDLDSYLEAVSPEP